MTIYVGPRITTATGGNLITNIPGFTVHTFTSSGTFVPTGSGYVDVLVVGAGAGSGNSLWSGGGGGGSVQYQKFIPVLSGVSYPMVVSVGSAPNVNALASTCTYNGGSVTARGGTTSGVNNPLGSAGGGAANSPATIGAGVVGLGFGGGLGAPSGSGNFGAGGGGAGGAGQNGQQPLIPLTPLTGRGGPGLPYSITGSPIFYGGGGSGWGTAINPTSSPIDFGLGGQASTPGSPGNPGVIIVRYIT
jgi:hypothetical protein